MKVYIIGHAISPYRGSEPGFTWNWAWELSQHVPVEVLAYPQYCYEVDSFLAENPTHSFKVHWVTPRGLDPWRPEAGERGIHFHYLLWLWEVRSKLRKLLKAAKGKERVIIHQVSWGTLSAPPPYQGLGIPIVWGPVGGGQCAPASFKRYFNGWWKKEVLRTLRLRFLPYFPVWRAMVKQYSLILVVNYETERLLRAVGAKDVHLFLDAGVPRGFGLLAPPEPQMKEGFTLLWAGRLEPRKALPLALEALAQVRDPVHLVVAGDGPMRETWRRYARELGVQERVTFLGMVSREEMIRLFQNVDAFIFTSLRDTFGSVVLEAMAFGLPVIVPDHQGVGAFVPANAGIKVPVSTPELTVRGFAEAIERLYKDYDLRFSLARGAWASAQEHRWERKVERMLELYEKILD